MEFTIRIDKELKITIDHNNKTHTMESIRPLIPQDAYNQILYFVSKRLPMSRAITLPGLESLTCKSALESLKK